MNKFYVNVENILLPSSLKGTVILEASSILDLKNKILQHYGFVEHSANIQLWSHRLGASNRIRMDTLSEIPHNCENVWVRATPSLK